MASQADEFDDLDGFGEQAAQDAPGDELDAGGPEVDELGDPTEGDRSEGASGGPQDGPDGDIGGADEQRTEQRSAGAAAGSRVPPNLAPYVFKPGQSGNPKGRPRQKHILTIMAKQQRQLALASWRQECERARAKGERRPPRPQEDEVDTLIAAAFLQMILVDRSPSALMEYMNRKYGPVKDGSTADVAERLAELAAAMRPKPGARQEDADDPELERRVRESHRFDEDPADAEYAVVSSTPGLPPAPPRRQRDDVDGSNIVADGPVLQAPIEPAEDDLDDEEGFD